MKSTSDFYKAPNGSCRSQCKTCESKYRPSRKWWLTPANLEKAAARARRQRRDPSFTCRHILADCRKSDRKRGFGNDLTLDFIVELTKEGCVYCGETQIRMSLDRIDNTIGHVQSNVNPACIRCNYARGSMPYEAWKCLLKGVREARERGLFGAWLGRARTQRADGTSGVGNGV